jgi:predicted HTH domain antitoxin
VGRISDNMEHMVLTLELPDNIAQALSVPGGADLSRKALEALAIEGFREKKLSQFQVGQMLGLSRIEAEKFLARHADLHAYDPAELQQEADRLASLPRTDNRL